MQNNRARWYDAGLGRFLSEDPSGVSEGNDPNAYRYVGNSPTNRTGPTGLVQAGNPLDALFGGYRAGPVQPFKPISPALAGGDNPLNTYSTPSANLAPPSVQEASDYFFRNSTLFNSVDARQLTFPSWQTIQDAMADRAFRESTRIYAAADFGSYINDPVLNAVDAVFGNTRVQGGLRAATGVAQVGAGLLATGIPFIGPVLGPAIGVRGADNIAAGFTQLATDGPQETKTGAALANTLEFAGVSAQNARAVGAYLESSFDIITSLTGLSGPRGGLRQPEVTTTIGKETGAVAPNGITPRKSNTLLPSRVTGELHAGETRTAKEVAQARSFFERNRAAAKQWW